MLLAASLLLALSGSPNDPPSDWPHFLGPNRNAVVPADGLRLDWSGGGPDVAWRVGVGAGYGGAAVRDGQVFILDREIGERDVLRVFDLQTGEELWGDAYEAPGRLQFPGSRTVPSVTEEFVVTCGGFGHVAGFTREEQLLEWSLDMTEVFGGELPMFGWSCSPLVLGDVAIVTPLGDEVGLVALDVRTGEDVWVTEPVGFSHSTPVLVELFGKPQVLFLSTRGQASGQDEASPSLLSSFDPEDGSLLWQYDLLLTRLPIPGPVQIDGNRLFVTGGYRGGSTMLRLEETGGEVAVEEVFRIARGAQIHQPLLHGEHLYVLVNENWNNARALRKEGGLLCLDLEGNEVWRTGDDPYFGRGGALLVGDQLLIQDGFNGVLSLVEATPAGYRLRGQVDPFEVGDRRDHQMWAPLALSGRRLLMRSQDELVCVQL